jgi:redox-sensitive bicupin YhaK (pirin superfamily)
MQTYGVRRGHITRLVSPSDIGEVIKPFVFLDYGDLPYSGGGFVGIHPHSGIATLTLAIRGSLAYEDTTGKTGVIPSGGLEWMKAGNGVWHDGAIGSREGFRFFQLWVAMPAAEENAPPESQYISPDDVEYVGPAQVVLGSYGGARSKIRAPEGMNYLHVQLQAGERWTYRPPAGHTVAWVSVYEGDLQASDVLGAGVLAVFEENNESIEFVAGEKTSFVLGSAIKHPHDLVLGYYSVHTNEKALERGETEIARLRAQLKASGRLARA